jgi:hypothetical protein
VKLTISLNPVPKFKKQWSYNFTFPYAFIACSLIKRTNKYTSFNIPATAAASNALACGHRKAVKWRLHWHSRELVANISAGEERTLLHLFI